MSQPSQHQIAPLCHTQESRAAHAAQPPKLLLVVLEKSLLWKSPKAATASVTLTDAHEKCRNIDATLMLHHTTDSFVESGNSDLHKL